MQVEAANAVHAKAIELGEHVLRMTTAAGSGHPSSALALVHIIVELMYRRMRHDPADPWNSASDRLVLSAGHAVPIVYAAYADLRGAVGTCPGEATLLELDDLATLRELTSVLDGHPNPGEGFPFFDAATGSLGQGLSVAAGLALAARLDGFDKRIFVILGDGESREGQVWEAADFIVDHRLNNICAVFSCNTHGQAGPVSDQQSANVLATKTAAFGWEVVTVDGHDPGQLATALARVGTTAKPLAVIAQTVKGWGVDLMIGRNFHGKPVSEADLDRACAQLHSTGKRVGAVAGDWPAPPTPPIPPLPRGGSGGSSAQLAPPRTSSRPIVLPPFEEALERSGLTAALKDRKLATRAAYGAALVALGDADHRIVCLDGDVSNSTFANLFAKSHPDRFFECKIAEQNMISVGVGLAATGKIPFASSFGKFIARAVDQIDLASISRANLKIVGSHCGVSLGPDGPSQMSLADVAYFRSMSRVHLDAPTDSRTDGGPGRMACHVFHPSDAVSAYRCCELMANVEGMCYLRTHRPAAPFLYPTDERFELGGCKWLRNGGTTERSADLTLVSSGYILHTVLEAAERLSQTGIACDVFDAYTFPLSVRPILEAARAGGGIILTVEDNYPGGLHSELAEAAAERAEIRVFGLTVSRIPKSAKTAGEVFSHVGVGLEQIIERATALVRK